MELSRLPRSARVALAVAGVLLVLAALLPWWIAPVIGARLRAEARARGLEASWSRIAFHWPLRVELTGFRLVRAGALPPAAEVERVELALGPRGFSLRPRVSRLVLESARVTLPAGGGEDDAIDEREAERDPATGPAAPRVRHAAQQLADLLLLPARRLPELRVSRLSVARGETPLVAVDALTLTHGPHGVQLATTGELGGEHHVPFDAALQWNRDDRLVGRVDFRVSEGNGRATPLGFVVDGRITQDRRAGLLRVDRDTRLSVGPIVFLPSGEVRRNGPRFSLALAVDGLTAKQLQRRVPRAVLGPLADLPVTGAWDWRASLDVNVAAPESTRFTADVIPHGLALAPGDTRLGLDRLAGPFLAEIHVHDRVVYRDLSDANPHFRTLDRVSPLLQHALLTNEDGGFYHHRGFNTEAIQLAMADNLRSGTFRRGAGTVTMQLARNLFLGHQRTLSRKGQEVVLAWILEHLTGLSKDRLLEIYLNIIEWGPDVHGADEAAHYYFDKDADAVTLDEALFLAIVVPSPMRWRTRVDARGELRPWARAQMAYIARKMATRDWLPPEQVPTAEFLSITLRGPAAAVLAPADTIIAQR